MKTRTRRSKAAQQKKYPLPPGPQMTRELAEARAVEGGKGKFDGAAFLRTLKK
jgi:hypothetical protein